MSAAAAGGPQPARLRVRMYQVGFGDCFLLSFEYDEALDDGRFERHMLIDFGTMSLAKSPGSLLAIAKRIRHHAGGKLDVVVATHRHKDHVSAFASDKVIAQLVDPGFPRLVVRSWTEHPTIASDATGGFSLVSNPSPDFGTRSRRLLVRLAEAEAFATGLVELMTRGGSPKRGLAGEVARIADDQVKNAAAVEQFRQWAAAGDGKRGEYLHYGKESRIGDVIPGLGVKVMGPPTVEQHPGVTRQRDEDEDEFWMVYRSLMQGLSVSDVLGSVPRAKQPGDDDDRDADTDPAAIEAPRPGRPIGPLGPTRWLTNRMSRQQLSSMMRIVRILDTVLNNSSLILLFEVATAAGPLRLLFPGDAQIENWEYALKLAEDHEANLDLLREVDLYKVGHHGSRNATPRTLYDLWNEAGTSGRPMVGLLSTKCGVHGEVPATHVPRKTLVAALDTRMTLYNTRSLDSDAPYFELVADLTADRSLTKVAGPDTRPDPCPL